MRTRRAALLVSSLILACWSVQAMAQVAGSAASVPSSADDEASNSTAPLPPGVVRKPSPDSPGVVTGIRLGELYTDNLKLVPDDQPKQDAWISVVKPFINSAYKGPWLQGVFNAQLTGYLYAGQSDYNQLAEHLNAHDTLTVAPEHLFLYSAATYGRAVIDNELPAGAGTFFLTNNRANVGTFLLSPYWVQGLGRVGTMNVRLSRGWVFYNRSGISGAQGESLTRLSDASTYGEQLSIVSLPGQIWGWALSYAGKRVKTDSGLSLQFATAQAELSRMFGQHSRVLVQVGKENRYYTDGRVDTLGARFWAVGYSYEDQRNSFKLMGGHRFYGRSANLSWTHHAARLTTHVAYKERPTDLNEQLMTGATGLGRDLPRNVSGLPSLFVNRIYLMKRFSASAHYLMPKGALTVTLFNESRDFFLRGIGHETVSDAHLSWRFELGPMTTITPTFGWRRYRFSDQRINYTRYEQLAAVHEFANGDSISLRVRHESRSVHTHVPGGLGYHANVIYFEWTHLFGKN